MPDSFIISILAIMSGLVSVLISSWEIFISRRNRNKSLITKVIDLAVEDFSESLGINIGANLFLVKREKKINVLQNKFSSSRNKDKFFEDSEYTIGEGIPGQVWLEKRPMHFSFSGLSKNYDHKKMEMKSILALPVYNEKRSVVGVLEFFSDNDKNDVLSNREQIAKAMAISRDVSFLLSKLSI